MNNKKFNIIDVEYGENNCPADALMNNFRTRAHDMLNYLKNIEFSKRCVDFFRDMADIIEESDDNICFKWYEVKEKELPPLTVKLRKANGKYILQFLKEIGEEVTLIKGKQRKGKNKNGKINIEKQTGKEGEER